MTLEEYEKTMNNQTIIGKLEKGYKSLEKESKNKGRPKSVKNNVNNDDVNINALQQKISELENKLTVMEDAVNQKLDDAAIIDIARKYVQDETALAIERLEIIKDLCDEREKSYVYIKDVMKCTDNGSLISVINEYKIMKQFIDEQINSIKKLKYFRKV